MTALSVLGGGGVIVAPEIGTSSVISVGAPESGHVSVTTVTTTEASAASADPIASGIRLAGVDADASPRASPTTGGNLASAAVSSPALLHDVASALAPTRGQGATFSGSTARPVSSGLLPKLGGRALLDQLALLPTAGIVDFVTEHPGTVARLLSDAPSASAVARWWSSASESSRVALIAGAPEIVGNLDGLDAAVRDEANRMFLRESIADARASLDGLGRAEKADAQMRLHMLEQIQVSLVTTAGQPDRSLLSVDTAWPGRAAVVVGDLGTADYVSYLVPGMFFTVDGQIVDWTVISQDYYDEQARLLRTLEPTDEALASRSVAVVSWIGYQTPGVADVISLDLAEGGAKYISSAVNGLRAAREGDEPYTTLVTHSYGSTATMMALQDGTVSTDALVVIGSPGSSAQSVADLGLPADKVFVGEAAWDPVVNSAFFGSDPGSASFGATPMDVGAEIDPLTGRELTAASGHLGYFDAGTTAMRNMALVGLDRGDLVGGRSDRVGQGTQLAEG